MAASLPRSWTTRDASLEMAAMQRSRGFWRGVCGTRCTDLACTREGFPSFFTAPDALGFMPHSYHRRRQFMRLDRLAGCLAICICAVPAALSAQGYQLNEIGTCAVARAQAVVGVPCKDPSSIYWNPAATVDLRGWSVYTGITAIVVGADFTADTSGRVTHGNVPVSFPPALFVNYASKDGRWAAGVGAYVPYGLSSQW